MKIGLDFDGVIANYQQLKSDAAKRMYGLDIPPSNFIKKKVISEGAPH